MMKIDLDKFDKAMATKTFPFEAKKGARAFDAGEPLSANPHPIPTKKRADWQLGWLEAKYAEEYWEDQNKKLEKILDVPYVFWTCTNGCRGRVEWNKECTEAVCLECGRKSTEK